MNKALSTITLVVFATVSLSAQIPKLGSLIKKNSVDSLSLVVKKEVAPVIKSVSEGTIPPIKTENGIPLVGDPSDADEEALGRECIGRMVAAYPLVQNDSLQEYVNRVGRYVALQSARPVLNYTFGAIASDDINAFAMPGGYIVVTLGLYKLLADEAQLAAVLGHEIAHVNLRHLVRLMQKDALIAKGSAFFAGQTRDSSIKKLVGTGALISARTLDRQAEFDCDRLGVEYAAKAGYDPFGYVELLDKMGALQATSDRYALLFKTHPSSRDRVDALSKAMGSKWANVGGVIPKRWVVVP